MRRVRNQIVDPEWVTDDEFDRFLHQVADAATPEQQPLLHEVVWYLRESQQHPGLWPVRKGATKPEHCTSRGQLQVELLALAINLIDERIDDDLEGRAEFDLLRQMLDVGPSRFELQKKITMYIPKHLNMPPETFLQAHDTLVEVRDSGLVSVELVSCAIDVVLAVEGESKGGVTSKKADANTMLHAVAVALSQPIERFGTGENLIVDTKSNLGRDGIAPQESIPVILERLCGDCGEPS